jgi:hypothetical protein
VWKTSFATAAITLSLVFAGAASSAPEVDQQQSAVDPTFYWTIGGPIDRRFAQIITAGIPGFLTEVQLPVACDPQASLFIEIRTDHPGISGSTMLASRVVPGSSLPSGNPGDFQSITLPDPPFIAAESHFAVVVASSEQGCSALLGPENVDSYQRGAAFSHDAFVDWTAFPNRDMAFKTFVERRCRVPALVGNTGSEVGEILVQYGCVVGTLSRAYSKTVPAGNVVSQSQSPGTDLPPGSAVDVVVSRGVRHCVVPNVRRKKLAQARAAIVRARCRLGRVRLAPSSRAMRGRVIRQKPVPGKTLAAGARVSLVVGRG